MQSISHLPNFLIFLDIDGVLNTHGILNQEVDKKIKAETGESNHTYFCKNTCKICKTAGSSLFENTAIESLNNLIERMQKLANVAIILSSNWRCGHSVKELKEILNKHEFSKLITDKTRGSEINPSKTAWWSNCSISHFVESEDGVKIQQDCRANEINTWLKKHRGYRGYIVIDDQDRGHHLSANFGSKFIHTERKNQYPLFTREKAEEAYTQFLLQI